MNEKLLQYLWNFKVFKRFDFRDVSGTELEVLNFGIWNFDSGPDFLYGRIRHRGVELAGHIELHVKSSDWIFHQHTGNPEFNNIICHVVYTHDMDLPEFTQAGIPTIELKEYIDDSLISQYQNLLSETQFIPCEKMIGQKWVPVLFHEGNLLKKLDQKSNELDDELDRYKNDYEAVLFHQLAYAFGLKVNATIFRQLAQSLDYTVVNKIRHNPVQLEALFLGTAGWPESAVDPETAIWKREYDFLRNKFTLPENTLHPKFSRLRPPNFPTIRLSQLANLYHTHQNLFSQMMNARNAAQLFDLFKDIKASKYWDTRFNFGKISSVQGEKYLTKDFIQLILINAVLPLKYSYARHHHEEAADEILDYYATLTPEKNNIIDGWKSLGLQAQNALQTQSLLYHYSYACQPKNCLNCGIGVRLMNPA